MAKKQQGSRKAPRKHDPRWKDNTRTARSDKRKSELQAAAVRDGFETYSEAMTAWKNGNAVLVKKQANTNASAVRRAGS